MVQKLTARPTVPRPKTAIKEPGSTFTVFQIAPRPKRQQIYNTFNQIIEYQITNDSNLN